MNDETMLTIKEAAQRIRVSPDTIRRSIRSNALTAYKPGAKYLVRESDLEAFLESRKTNGDGR